MNSRTKSTGRRIGKKDSATRAALVQAGIDLLQQEGASAFSARRVAEVAGLKPQLVHYYFRTMEELLVAIAELAGSRSLERAVHAAESRESLRELWKFVLAERSATLVVEMKTLGQGSPAVGAEMRRQLGLYRTRVIEVVERHLSEAGIKSAQRAAAFVLLCDAISLLLVNERAMGFTQGHQELQAVIEEWLNQFYR